MTAAQLTVEHAKFNERVSTMRSELDAAHDILRGIKDDQVAIRQQNALQQQALEEQRKRLELWDSRWWQVQMAVYGALLTTITGLLTAIIGLIVALVKR